MICFFYYWLRSKANAVNQTIHLCFYEKSSIGQSVSQSIVQAVIAKNKKQYTSSNIMHIKF